MDPLKRQTSTATPAEPGGLLSDARIEAENLAIMTNEVAEFAATRDRLQSIDIPKPIPPIVVVFWPHFLAVGFALSLAKAIAAYFLI